MDTSEPSLNIRSQHITWLMEQARMGHHALFERDAIRSALINPTEEFGDSDTVVRVLHQVIHHLTQLDTLTEQREFIDEQPLRIKNVLIQLYFRLLDQMIRRGEVTLH